MSRPTPEHATATLQQLQDDRERLESLTQTPWWAPVALGLVVGLWVGSAPVTDRTTGYLLALVAALLVASLVRTRTGIRLRRSGARQWSLAILWLLATLVLYSVALALGSLGEAAWAMVPALAAAGLTSLTVRVSDRWAREARGA
ncbi:hypothetical protein [Ornithinimicrobium flavum]|uniref:hypothetical protein n=1 Tax=Ornithinimicrobium flavum TaxID=1288636 RepID=UPI00106F87C8|nr:hypothetical protein [Ornithinimicrobium flavum]